MADIAAVKADYIGTELTVAEIASKHGLSGGGRVSNLAREHSWPRRWFTGGRLATRSPLRSGPRVTSATMLGEKAQLAAALPDSHLKP